MKTTQHTVDIFQSIFVFNPEPGFLRISYPVRHCTLPSHSKSCWPSVRTASEVCSSAPQHQPPQGHGIHSHTVDTAYRADTSVWLGSSGRSEAGLNYLQHMCALFESEISTAHRLHINPALLLTH